MNKILLTLILIVFSGCASMNRSGFYGVQINQMTEDRGFKITGVTDSRVEHTFTDTMSTEVTAWAKIQGKKILITVINSSGDKLVPDYFFDRFKLVTKRGEEFQLKKESPTIYSYRVGGDFIKPSGKALFVLRTTRVFLQEDVEKIVCQIGLLRGARIVLKPIP